MPFLDFSILFSIWMQTIKTCWYSVIRHVELQRMPNSFEIYVVSFCRNKFQRYNGYLTLVNNRIIYSTCQVPIQYVYLCIEPPFQTYFIQGITTDLFHGKRTFYSDKNGSIPWKLYCWNVFRISLNYNGIWNIFVINFWFDNTLLFLCITRLWNKLFENYYQNSWYER